MTSIATTKEEVATSGDNLMPQFVFVCVCVLIAPVLQTSGKRPALVESKFAPTVQTVKVKVKVKSKSVCVSDHW